MTAARPHALITGASSGIGQAVAIDLAHHGYDVIVSSRAIGRLDATVAAVEAAGGRATRLELDQANVATSAAALASAWEEAGGIDLLVNNAAELIRRAALEVDPAEWDQLMATNLRGPFFLSQAFARRAIEADRPGCIVNVGSTHGRAVLVERAVYGIAKAGLDHLTRALAVEWAPHGIRVNAVIPSTVSTPSREAAMRDPEVRARMTARIPAGRFATPEEVAAAVRFLAHPEAGFITGETLVIDGGLTVV
jgi:glucose 1-dehydrogenase